MLIIVETRRREGIWELSVLSAEFFCKPKIDLKIKTIFLIEK